jgi:hypothetical protein
MAVRDTLLANLSVALASANVTTASELPFTAAGVPLYDKNMKKLYLSYDQTEVTELLSTLDNNDVPQREITVEAYFTVDAKNLPGDIDTIVSKVLNSRLAVANCFTRECSLTNEFTEDRLTYNFSFRFLTI